MQGDSQRMDDWGSEKFQLCPGDGSDSQDHLRREKKNAPGFLLGTKGMCQALRKVFAFQRAA